MVFQKFKNITKSFIKCGLILSFLAFAACGGGGGGTGVQTENGTNKISADAGGTVTYNNAVKLTVSANSLSGDADIKIEPVTNAPSGDADTLLPAGQAYRFTPAGTTFSLSKPAVLELSYDETVLAQKGYSADTLRIYYYDEGLKEYVAVAGYVDTTNKKIVAYVEHFTIYMAMAKAKLAGNNAPYAALQNPIPNPVRADAPIYIRASATDYDGSLAGVKVYYRKLQPTPGAWNMAIMSREVRPENTVDTYAFLIPGNFLTSSDLGTGNDIEYYVTATDNHGAITTTAIRRLDVTRTYVSGSLNLSPSSLEIAAGFERYFIARGVDSTSATFQLIPETCSVQLGKGTVKNCFASGILFHASAKTDAGVPEHLVVTAGADTASAEINIRSGEIKSVEILDTNGNKITGDIILSRYDVYEFDAVGYDEFGNTVDIFPTWTVDSYLGTLDTVNPDNAGKLTAGGTGTGKIRIQLGNFSDDQQVMVRPKLVSTDPADGAINILLDADVRLVFTNNIDPTTVNLTTLRVKRLEGTVEYDVPGSFVVYNEFVSFVPDSLVPLQQYTYYKVEVTGGIHETGGTPVTPFTYTFRTVWVQGTVTYYGNGNDGGIVPVDTTNYGENAIVTVLDNTGSLTKTGYNFMGWNTAPDGSGTTYSVGQTFNISVVGASLYAVWGLGSSVTYDGNGNTSGTVPTDSNLYASGASVIVMAKGSLVKMQDGISLYFSGWNTAADGSGTSHAAGSTFVMGAANVTLYAQWSILRGTGPAGGFVFYDKGSYSGGWRYLEAAPYDQSDGMGWGTYWYDPIAGYGWSTFDAIDLCNNLIIGSYSDWFLPSKDHLNLIYVNLKAHGVGGFIDYYYWSSTYDPGEMYVWAQNFNTGQQYNLNLIYSSISARVRAARQF